MPPEPARRTDLVETVRRAAVHLARNNPALICTSYRLWKNRPIESWPGLLSKLYTIELPRAVVRRPFAAPSGDSNVNILFRFLEESRGIEGNVAECGVYLGASIVPMAIYLEQHGIGKHIYGFDSFEGFDESVAVDLALGGADDPQKRVAGFSEASYERLARKLRWFELHGRVSLVKGYFNRTLPRFSGHTFSFVHLDCDIYESYRETLEFFYPRVSTGGVILFDEYNDPPWPGCNKAVDEFFAGKAEKPQMIESDGYQKWFVRKGSAE